MENRGIKGFTLLELMLVICVAGILSGFAYFGKDLIHGEEVLSCTRELFADIQSARMRAITQAGKGYGIRFESPTTYVLFQFNDCDNNFSYDASSCGGNTREESNPVRKTISPRVVLKKSTRDVENDIVIFDSFGRPRQKKWGMGMQTILVTDAQGKGVVRCISISLNRVRESTWNGSSCI